MPKQDTARRFIRFEPRAGTDQEPVTIEFHRVVAINRDIPTLLAFETMLDGRVRLTYNAVRVPDLSKVEGLTIIRMDE